MSRFFDIFSLDNTSRYLIGDEVIILPRSSMVSHGHSH